MGEVGMTKKDANALRLRIRNAIAKIEKTSLQVGKDLLQIKEGGLWELWGYDSFRDYVLREPEIKFSERTINYMVSVARWARELPTEANEWVESLGWTAASKLTGKVDAKNWESWQDRVEGKSVSEIEGLVKTDNEQASQVVSESADGASASPPPEPKEQAKKKVFALFPEQFENVELALTKAKEMANSAKEGNALDLMATNFLAFNGTVDDSQILLDRIEEVLGVRIVAVSSNFEEIVYGQSDTLEALNLAVEETDDDDDAVVEGEE